MLIEGFLRSETSLIQTRGRAARNAEGRVIMYADSITDSMRKALSETNRRRQIQEDYNQVHGIIPKTIKKKVHDLIRATKAAEEPAPYELEKDPESMSKQELQQWIKKIQKEMKQAAANLQFEQAAFLRDQLLELKKQEQEL